MISMQACNLSSFKLFLSASFIFIGISWKNNNISWGGKKGRKKGSFGCFWWILHDYATLMNFKTKDKVPKKALSDSQNSSTDVGQRPSDPSATTNSKKNLFLNPSCMPGMRGHAALKLAVKLVWVWRMVESTIGKVAVIVHQLKSCLVWHGVWCTVIKVTPSVAL